MKGIKECLNWMLDNPMKELESENQYNVRYNDLIPRYELFKDETWSVVEYFGQFDMYYWQEVIEPVDFITAYNDCLENGTKYRGVKYKQDTLERTENAVFGYTTDKDSNAVWLDQKWIKVV